MKSMTGYAIRDYQDTLHQLSVELKSYNGRYLDIYVYLPQSLSTLEPKCREYLSERNNRGKIELTVRYHALQEDISFAVDRNTIAGYAHALKEIAAAAEIKEEISLDHILHMEELVKTHRVTDADAVWEIAAKLLAEAQRELTSARDAEGASTARAIRGHLETVTGALGLFTEKSSDLEAHVRQTVSDRFSQVLEDAVPQDRVLAEIASLLLRYGIDEEITRLRGHVDAFRRIMESDGPVGKKLDFLCQEMQREVNTIGSKSTMLEVNHMVVDAKDAIEKIREQLRNVE